MVWYSHLFKNFPEFVVIHTAKGFGIVNKAEIDVFLELSCFFNDPTDVGNLISGSSAFSKASIFFCSYCLLVSSKGLYVLKISLNLFLIIFLFLLVLPYSIGILHISIQFLPIFSFIYFLIFLTQKTNAVKTTRLN